jgi:AraC-like DNA-binding protein/TolB-like protein
MRSTNESGDEFLKRLTDIVNENITNKQFGVSMLAKEMGMSRANLHRKVNAIAKISVSQFIRQERLKRAKKLLRTSSETVSEVAYEVGFNNVSYFIKCFHEYYGYSPGEVGQREADESDPGTQIYIRKNRLKRILITAFSAIVLALALLIIFKPFIFKRNMLEPTLAVLPPYYEPQDSSYAKPVNGSVQNIIDNLNRISDIKVTPWLSVLQYKNSDKPAPEIAAELRKNYLVKPSILTYNDKIQLNITIIEGKKDNQIWTHAYDIDINDLTILYQKISKDIAKQIKAEITPEEKYKIEKLITLSGEALNYYNEGVGFINSWLLTSYINYADSAIMHFENALKCDSTCASAYAQIARMYYRKYIEYLSGREPEKSHSEQIYKFAEKANLYDPELDLTLIALSLYNYFIKNYDLAIGYGKKALEYNPNSSLAIHFLCHIYFRKSEHKKVLETAFNPVNSDLWLKSISGNLISKRTYWIIGMSYQHLGFFDRALKCMDTLLVIDPDFVQAINLKSRIFSNLRDYKQSVMILSESIEKGKANVATHSQLGRAYYMLRDFSSSAKHYKKLLEQRKGHNLSEYLIAHDAWHIALVLLNTGETEKAQKLITEQFEHPYFQDPRLRSYSLMGYYALQGDTANAMEQLRIFYRFKEHMGMIRLFKDAPVYDILQNIPEYKQLVSEMEARYWENHEQAKKSLEAKGLL